MIRTEWKPSQRSKFWFQFDFVKHKPYKSIKHVQNLIPGNSGGFINGFDCLRAFRDSLPGSYVWYVRIGNRVSCCKVVQEVPPIVTNDQTPSASCTEWLFRVFYCSELLHLKVAPSEIRIPLLTTFKDLCQTLPQMLFFFVFFKQHLIEKNKLV